MIVIVIRRMQNSSGSWTCCVQWVFSSTRPIVVLLAINMSDIKLHVQYIYIYIHTRTQQAYIAMENKSLRNSSNASSSSRGDKPWGCSPLGVFLNDFYYQRALFHYQHQSPKTKKQNKTIFLFFVLFNWLVIMAIFFVSFTSFACYSLPLSLCLFLFFWFDIKLDILVHVFVCLVFCLMWITSLVACMSILYIIVLVCLTARTKTFNRYRECCGLYFSPYIQRWTGGRSRHAYDEGLPVLSSLFLSLPISLTYIPSSAFNMTH